MFRLLTILWRMLQRILTLAAILSMAVASCAGTEGYSFRTFTQVDGLIDLTVNCFLQDRTGFLWIGTNNGLFRYDGHRFRRFGTESGLSSAGISSLVEANDGTLWVGAALKGVSRKSGDRFVPEDLKGSLLSLGPQTLARNPSGDSVYIATSNGLVSISANAERTVIPNSIGRAVYSVFDEPGKGIWYTFADQVCLWSESDSQCYGNQAGFVRDDWGGLAVDGNGTLWVRSGTRLLALAAGAAKFESRGKGLASTSIDGAVCLDSHQHLMIPTDAGLARWVDSRWSLIGPKEGLAVASAMWAIEDNEGSLWIGMRGGGLARGTESEEWENWTTGQGLDNDQVWSVAHEGNGDILIGTGSGLSRLRNGRITQVPGANLGLTSNRVRAIATGSDNTVWLGMSPGGAGLG